jgi:hypothetical protein
MNALSLRPHRADLVLNLSILSLYFFPFGLLAWFLGGRDLAQMNAGVMDPSGRGTIHCARFIGTASALINFVLFAGVVVVLCLLALGVRAIV